MLIRKKKKKKLNGGNTLLGVFGFYGSGVKLVEVEDDVNSFNKEGGSSAASEHVNLDAGYDSSFEDGSSKEPNVTRGRRKKKLKNAITNIVAQEYQGPTMDECHEKLKSMRLEPEDPIYLAATDIFCQSKSYREAFDGAVSALNGTLIHASVSSDKRAMTSKEKFNHAHAKLRNVIERAFGVLKACFPLLKSMPKFPLVKQRDITIACFAIHNFIRKGGLSDDFFAQYDQSDIHVSENVCDDNDGDVEVAQPIGSETDQQYMINLRDNIATQIMQARF
ncbi:putative nuclease HARBI1 [Tanacetum coccineum]